MNAAGSLLSSRLILFLCFLLLAGQIVDSVSFACFYLYVVPYSTAQELNPIVNFLMNIGGPTIVVAVKLGIGYRVWRTAPKFMSIRGTGPKVLMWLVLPIAAISGWVGFIFNSIAIGNTLG